MLTACDAKMVRVYLGHKSNELGLWAAKDLGQGLLIVRQPARHHNRLTKLLTKQSLI